MKKTRINLITTELRPRHFKISKALNRELFDVVFHLHPNDNIVDVCGTRVMNFRSPQELIGNCKHDNKAINHYLGVWNNDFAIHLLANSEHPLVYETYDQLHGCCNPSHIDYPSLAERQKELLCFQEADFVTYRDFRFTCLASELIKDRPNSALLLDGCLTGKSYGKFKKINLSNIKFVYCGNLPEPDSKSSRNYHLEFANRVAEHGAEYHVYPLHKKVLNQYREVHGNLEYLNNFFIHEPLPYPNLILELTKYDVGVDLLSINGDREHDTGDFYSIECSNYASNNKLFDYIDAGLQVITHNSAFNKEILKNTDGIHFIQSFDQILNKLSSTSPRAVIPNEFKLSHTSRILEEIYSSLLV